jgi:hypothetical protein
MTQPKELQLKSFTALAKETGCWFSTTNNNEQRRNQRILNCLREQRASELAVVRGPDIIFSPTVESYESQESEKFLPDTVYNLLKARKVNKVTWLIGVNSAEWMSTAASMKRYIFFSMKMHKQKLVFNLLYAILQPTQYPIFACYKFCQN